MTGCGGEGLESARLDREISINGMCDDWAGALRGLKKHGLSIGLLNDGEYFYLCLVIDDRKFVDQMLLKGLTVGFRPEGRGGEAFRVVYPVGTAGPRCETLSALSRAEPGGQGVWLDSLFRMSTAEMMLQGQGDLTARRMGIGDGTSISVAVTLCALKERETLIYELRVPLQKSGLQPYAIGAPEGGRFVLTLESGDIDHTELSEPTQSPARPRGPGCSLDGADPARGPDGDSRRGGQDGTRKGPRPVAPERLEMIFQVTLAGLPVRPL
jgi:hypothetical protein